MNDIPLPFRNTLLRIVSRKSLEEMSSLLAETIMHFSAKLQQLRAA